MACCLRSRETHYHPTLVLSTIFLAYFFASEARVLKTSMRFKPSLPSPMPLHRDTIVIAFTTIPARMMTDLPKMVQSLRMQIADVDRPVHFYLALPRTYKKKAVRANLRQLSNVLNSDVNQSAVEIEWVDDKGPTTRIIYAGQKYGLNHAILNVDDDEVYKPGMLKNFFDTYTKGGDGKRTIITKSIIQQIQGSYCMTHGEESGLTKVFESFAGVLYPPGFFTPDLIPWMQALPDFCQASDDYILSVWAERHGYDVRNTLSNIPLSLVQEPHLSEDLLVGDSSCKELGCPHGGFCSANTVHYERCREYLQDPSTKR